jgi:hypothetical protein
MDFDLLHNNLEPPALLFEKDIVLNMRYWMVRREADEQAPWPIYALDWVKWPHANLNHGAAIALGSFLEESANKVVPYYCS